MIYSFDIETIPNSSMIDKLPEPELKLGNVKDPEKIAEKKAEALIKMQKSMALDPMYGRICSAVFTYEVEGVLQSIPYIIGDDNDESEFHLLEDIFNMIDETTRLVTWNGIGFDLPFLYKRGAILGVQYPNIKLSEWVKRYTADRQIDLMQIWGGWNSQKFAKLGDVSNIFLGEGKIDLDVSKLPELLKTEEGRKKIIEYNTMDTVRTYQLFQKFQWGGLI